MDTPQKIHIGILSPATADRPHFKSLKQMLPPEVIVTHEGLGLLQNSYHDLEGKTDVIAARAADFVRRNQVQGLIVTGGFVTLFNPDLEAKVAEAVHIPVTNAVSSVRVALRYPAFSSSIESGKRGSRSWRNERTRSSKGRLCTCFNWRRDANPAFQQSCRAVA